MLSPHLPQVFLHRKWKGCSLSRILLHLTPSSLFCLFIYFLKNPSLLKCSTVGCSQKKKKKTLISRWCQWTLTDQGCKSQAQIFHSVLTSVNRLLHNKSDLFVLWTKHCGSSRLLVVYLLQRPQQRKSWFIASAVICRHRRKKHWQLSPINSHQQSLHHKVNPMMEKGLDVCYSASLIISTYLC